MLARLAARSRPRLLAAPRTARALCSEAADEPQSEDELGKTAFELCAELPNYGLGARLYRESWQRNGWEPEGHHYTLTHTTIFTEPGRKPSKAWGVRTWKGVPDKEPSELKQGGKREWLVLE